MDFFFFDNKNDGLIEYHKLNLYFRSIGAASGIDTSVVSARYEYVGLVQVSRYHNLKVRCS